VTLTDDAVDFFAQAACASLTALDLSSCVRVTTRSLLALAERCPNVRHLALTRYRPRACLLDSIHPLRQPRTITFDELIVFGFVFVFLICQV
jgi:hypothetical protein